MLSTSEYLRRTLTNAAELDARVSGRPVCWIDETKTKGEAMNPEYRTQGKCVRCHIRHTWPARGGILVSEATCPLCGTRLQRTTYQSKLTTRDWPHGLGNTGGQS